MSFFTDTITVFNHIRDSGTWHRNVIRGVEWTHYGQKVSIANGVVTYTQEECITGDFDKDYGNPSYVEPVVFDGMEDKKGYWTLNSQDKKDIVVLGEVTEEISSSHLSALKAKYQYCGVVSDVTDNRNSRRLKHIEVVVK